ncbi:MAG: amidohydrolase family protein [Paracoccus sp. (in: a-proteobacteria)]|uniref:amidohydrolase family protein n=1 Tax=Paracoccus sp. TaxID=267 RepID=UPI0026DF7675|nr:amidohydrolase family protein [Paracoccus sp. (in: a-proteobacteria)]MDO5632740.1 amidohydrolase family protein [Paracoccus sp. (in: a-proteobacteria)]
MHQIIDMRCRPAYLHDFFGRTPGTAEYDTVRWLNRRVGTRGDDQHFTRSSTPQGFLDEITDAGLSRAVVVGRQTPGQHLPNDDIAAIVALDHTRLIGIGAVDPALGQAALAEVERAQTLGLHGINIEPGFGTPPRHADDPAFFPLYDLLQSLNIPLFIMSGPTTPDPRFNDPTAVAVVAAAFPQLKIGLYHGFWPNVQAAIGVAFRHENVHLIPDMYLFQAGSDAYVQAANGWMGDQLLFGSSYPFRPIGQSISDAERLGLRADVLDRFFAGNAARLLSLPAAAHSNTALNPEPKGRIA